MNWKDDLAQTAAICMLLLYWAFAGWYFADSFDSYMKNYPVDFYFAMLVCIYSVASFMWGFQEFRDHQERYNAIHSIEAMADG